MDVQLPFPLVFVGAVDFDLKSNDVFGELITCFSKESF